MQIVPKNDMARSADCDRRLLALEQMLQDGRPRSAIEMACIERQRNDLLTGHERGLVWREEEAKRTLDLCSLVKHWKGDCGGKPFAPEPWQEHLIFAPLYGWFREVDGKLKRRFTTGYCEVPRKNGKTFTTSVIGLRGLVGDGEHGPEIYSAASTRDQAGRLFDDMRQATLNSRTLTNRIQVRAHALLGKHNNGVAKAVSAEAKTLHGTNPSVALLDELHAHADDSVYEAMRSGQGARPNPLLFMITTAGSGRNTVCWEQRELSRNVLEGHHAVDSHFAYIATAETDDDLEDPLTWWKANPNLRVSVSEDFLREESSLAAKMPSKENSFRRLHLNQWVEQADRWIPMSAWDSCSRTVTDNALSGRRCYIGVDAALTRDICSIAAIFPMDDGSCVVKPWFFAPVDEMNSRAERDRKHVVYWMQQGHVIGTDGNIIDFNVIHDVIADASRMYNVRGLVYDPRFTAPLIQRINETSIPVDMTREFTQSKALYNGPCGDFEKLVLDGKIVHNNNPVLRWMMSNTAISIDAAGCRQPDKKRSADKIDGISATIMAIAMWKWTEQAADSVYETRGVLMI